jgi:hypothetical protein
MLNPFVIWLIRMRREEVALATTRLGMAHAMQRDSAARVFEAMKVTTRNRKK